MTRMRRAEAAVFFLAINPSCSDLAERGARCVCGLSRGEPEPGAGGGQEGGGAGQGLADGQGRQGEKEEARPTWKGGQSQPSVRSNCGNSLAATGLYVVLYVFIILFIVYTRIY